MSKDKDLVAILLAILAAALYAISTPVSKVMLQTVAPTMVAAFIVKNYRNAESESTMRYT